MQWLGYRTHVLARSSSLCVLAISESFAALATFQNVRDTIIVAERYIAQCTRTHTTPKCVAVPAPFENAFHTVLTIAVDAISLIMDGWTNVVVFASASLVPLAVLQLIAVDTIVKNVYKTGVSLVITLRVVHTIL